MLLLEAQQFNHTPQCPDLNIFGGQTNIENVQARKIFEIFDFLCVLLKCEHFPKILNTFFKMNMFFENKINLEKRTLFQTKTYFLKY